VESQGSLSGIPGKRAWLVHDTKTPGFLTAAFIARRLRAEGCSWASFAGRSRTAKGIVTDRAKEFWERGVARLEEVIEPGDRVYFCCIPLLTYENFVIPREASNRIRKRLGNHGRFEVLSQRWPDQYSEIDIKSRLVPFELGEGTNALTSRFERSIAELILAASHQADPSQVDPEVHHLLDQLGRALSLCYRDPTPSYDAGRDLLESFLDEETAERLMKQWRGTPTEQSPGWALTPIAPNRVYSILIPSGEKEHREGKVRRVLRAQTDDHSAIGIGVQKPSPDNFRIYLLRCSDVVVDRPSLLRLLWEDGRRFDVPLPTETSGWIVADENTLTFVSEISKEASTPSAAEVLQTSIQEWAKEVSTKLRGDMGAPAILSKVLCQAGDEALKELDLAKKYVPRTLRFRPADTIIRFDAGNRTKKGDIRRTLVLTIEVGSDDGAAFLMRGDGYVLLKLEYLLQGVLLGLVSSRDPWLWSVRLVDRIRLNPEFRSTIDSDKLVEAMKRDVEAASIQDMEPSSVIGRALKEVGASMIVAYRETEMIGPSVQYGRAVASLAAYLAEGRQESLQVLDLFSGSGFSARVLKDRCQNSMLICVDAAVAMDQSLVAARRDVLWLQTTVEQLFGEPRGKGILSRQFDLIALDPPHAALLSISFGGLLETLSKCTKWLVIYQGHTSQSGSGQAVSTAIRKFFPKNQAETVVVDSEEIVVCGPDEWDGGTRRVRFADAIEKIKADLQHGGHAVRS